ncbi:MAG: FkbM family methyltransferase [Novosphingobium sp.]|nr:FkbM family methyltransferase [Novosphingobium sp.]
MSLGYAIRQKLRRARKLAYIVARPEYRAAMRRQTYPAIEHEEMFASQRFDTVIDVGANIGQFAVTAHCANPGAPIFCFEPLTACVSRLRALLPHYPRLTVFDYGLGAEAAQFEINVASNLVSSSILDFTDLQLETYPGITVVGKEMIRVDTLDAVATPEMTNGRTLLKMDVQGFELEVLKGSTATLERIAAVYLEASFLPLYAGQPLASDLVVWLDAQGFDLAAVYNVDHGAGSVPSQADCLFLRRNKVTGAGA